MNTEHNKKCSCYWGIASLSFKYYQRVVFRVKVLFLAPVVQSCTCHTCLLVWRGCCCGLSAVVTNVLTVLPVLKFSHHIATHCQLILWTPQKSAVWPCILLQTYSFHWKTALLSGSHIWTTMAVESPCLTDSYHHMCAGKWWNPIQCS
jgi:hypothetical protein